jgi:hypothetical protein
MVPSKETLRTHHAVKKRKAIGVSIAVAWMLALAGCTKTISRMDSNFNTQPLGPPAPYPKPTPPKDEFIWLKRQPLLSTLVANPSGGNFVMTVPTHDFVVNPDVRHQFLLASSEPFTTSPPPPIRGTFSIQIVGQGSVEFGLRADNRESGFIGGGSLETYPNGDLGDVGFLGNPGSLDYIAAGGDPAYPLPVTEMASYKGGETVHFFYSFDQASHTFYLSVTGGASGSDSTTYSFSGPIAELELWLFLRRVSTSTSVFVNNITMEELR